MIPEKQRKIMRKISQKVLDHLKNRLETDENLTAKDLLTISKTIKVASEVLEITKPELPQRK